MNLFSESLVRALGGALAHSLWQGAAAAALLALVLPSIRRASLRYWAACFALVCVFLSAAFTFMHSYGKAELAAPREEVATGIAADVPAVPVYFASEKPIVAVEVPEMAPSEPTWMERCRSRIEAAYPVLAALWLAGFTFFLLQLADGWYRIRQLRRRWVTEVSEEWQEIVSRMSQQLGLRRSVQLLESALAAGPLAIGYLRPVILFPFGLVNQLTPDEVEAVLAHELAHIARRDWVVNLLQSFMETIFYYHPAVWWISSIIRREREQSCDDMAVALTGKPLVFAKTLLKLAEMPASPPLTLALAAKGNHRRPLLLERIRRLLQTSQPASFTMEKTFATVTLLALLLATGIYSNKNNPVVQTVLAQISEPFDFPNETDILIAEDSIPKSKGKQKITRDDGKQRVELEVKDGNVTRLNIDGKEIPDNEFSQYRVLTDEIRRDVTPPPPPPGVWGIEAPEAPEISGRVMIAPVPAVPPVAPVAPRIITGKNKDGQITLNIEHNGEPIELIVKDGSIWKDGRKLEEGETLDLLGMGPEGYFYWNNDEGDGIVIDGRAGHSDHSGYARGGGRSWSFSSAEAREEARKAIEEAKEEARWGMEHARVEMKRLEQERAELTRRLRVETKENHARIQREMREAQRSIEQAQREISDNFREKNNWHYDVSSYNSQIGFSTEDIKRELVEDGLISDPENFTFEFSDKKLVVNGKKQPNELHEKYKKMYESATGKPMSNITMKMETNNK